MAEAVEEAAEVIKKEKKKVTNILTCILKNTSVSDLEIRIGSGFNYVGGSGFGSRRAKMIHNVSMCWMFSFED
jgi:hypothetical protein